MEVSCCEIEEAGGVVCCDLCGVVVLRANGILHFLD